MELAARPDRARVAQGILFGAPLVALGVSGWAHRWIFDDGFIYLRIVRQIRIGNGPVFNDGERVEAFTSPLWLAVLAVFDLVTPVRLEWIAVFLGLGLTVLGAALAVAAAARLARRASRQGLLVPAGILVFAAVLPTWYFATSGLETGLVFAWLGACLWVLTGWAGDPNSMSSLGAMVLGLGWLVRPELVVNSAVFCALVFFTQWRSGAKRLPVSPVAAMLLLPLTYQLFRMGYFGSVTANTAIAKEGTKLRLDAGWSYLLDFVSPYWLWLPIALLACVYVPFLARLRARHETRSITVVVAFVAAGLLNGLGVVAFGGDYVHGRLLLPALFAICAPVAVVPATWRNLAALGVGAWAAVCVVTLRPPQLDNPQGIAYRDGIAYVVPHRTQGRVEQNIDPALVRRLRRPALFVVDATAGFAQRFVIPDAPPARGLHLPAVVTGGIGALGYALGPEVTVIDRNGLADPLTGHLELETRGQTGHEKVLPRAWMAAMVTDPASTPRPEDFTSPPSISTPSPTDLSFDEQVEWARAALRCHDIADLRRSTTARLTLRRFASNTLHSFDRAQRRVPADPREAYERFCVDD